MSKVNTFFVIGTILSIGSILGQIVRIYHYEKN